MSNLQTAKYNGRGGGTINDPDFPLVGVPYVLNNNNAPYGIAMSGNLSAQGVYTPGSSYTTLYSSGAWFYFPATALATLPAGWYWTVFTALGSALVYTDSTATTLVVGTGAFTADAVSHTTPPIILPANSLGSSGFVEFFAFAATTNSVNTKTLGVNFGGSSGGSVSAVNGLGAVVARTVFNLGPKVQRIIGNASITGTTPASWNKDTTTDLQVGFNMTLGLDTEIFVIESYFIRATYVP